MTGRRTQVRACVVAVALASASLSAQPAERPSTAVTFSSTTPTTREPAIAEEARRALALLDDWLGPLGADRVTITALQWNRAVAGASRDGMIPVQLRWLTPMRDRSPERQLIAGLSRQYWRNVGGAFGDALSLYVGGRAIDELLAGRQFYADRYFGGFLSLPIRAVELSPADHDGRPRLRRYAELGDADASARQTARVLEVAERYWGWPAMQWALSVFRERGSTLQDFIAVASRQRGHDVSWLFADTLREHAAVDYAIESIENHPSGGRFEVRIAVASHGDGVFAHPLTVETRFADGTTVREEWDARQQRSTIEYFSASKATAAAIDPDAVVIVDSELSNNTMRTAKPAWNTLVVELTCHWIIWLQDAMLAYSGVA